MSMVADNQILNILRELNITKGLSYIPGYVSSDGSIAAPGAVPQEVTSEFIQNPFAPNRNYIALAYYPNASSLKAMWFGIGMYNANESFVVRNTIGFNTEMYDSDSNASISIGNYKPNSTEALCRLSFRTYGNVEIFLVQAIDLFERVLIPYGISEHQ